VTVEKPINLRCFNWSKKVSNVFELRIAFATNPIVLRSETNKDVGCPVLDDRLFVAINNQIKNFYFLSLFFRGRKIIRFLSPAYFYQKPLFCIFLL